jgi:hypothetical protein
MKQNLVEKTQEKKFTIFKKKNSFFLNWARPGPTILGWVGVASPLNSEPLHCSHAT